MSPMVLSMSGRLEITVKTTGLTGISVTKALTFTQEGSQGIEVVTVPNLNASLTVSEGTIDVTITLLGSAKGWSASEAGDNPLGFLTLPSSSGSGNGVLKISYSENTTASLRTGKVTLTATGGTGMAQTSVLTIRQVAAALHTLGNTPMFTPVLAGSNLTAAGGDISIALTLGAGATGWTAEESLGYVSLTSDNGDASKPVMVTYDANNTFVARDVVITITTTGPTGVPIMETLTFTQEGSQGIEVDTDPAVVLNLSTAAGSIDVDITLRGSAEGWSAVEADTNPADFLTLGGTSGVAGTDVLTIDYDGNTALALRTATVTLTATGGTGTAQDTVLTISQLGTGPNVVVSPSTGDFGALPAAGGTIVANVALTGGATGWTAVAESGNPDGFLTFSSSTTVTGSGTLSIAYAVNAGVARTGTVTFTTSGGGDAVPRTVSFTQLGAAPTISFMTNPSDLKTIPADPGASTGTITATITLGGGAESWTATKSADLTPVFISDFTSSGDRRKLTLTITYNQNTGVERDATLTLTTTGGTGGPATANLMITQLGAAPTITVMTSPSDLKTIPADPGGATGTITAAITLGGGATDWNATKSADLTPVFISDFTSSGDRDNLTLTITYNKNTDVERDATLTLTTTGGTGGPATVDLEITQLGATPTITVVTGASDISMIPAEPIGGGATGTITATITLGGGATDWTATKSADLNPVFISDFTSSGDRDNLTLTITYNQNTGVERDATLTLTTTGGTGGPATADLVLTQLAAAPTIAAVTTTNTVGSAAAVSFDPTTENLAAASTGTITATITLGGGATVWEASKSLDTGNAFITSFTASGDASTVLEIAYSVNTDAFKRDATINIIPRDADGARGTAFQLGLTQLAAAPTIAAVTTTNTVGSAAAVDFDPTTEKLAAASTGTLTATITLGGGATAWTAAKDGDTGDAFITSFTPASGDGTTNNVLTIAYSANTTDSERSATINITPADADGTTGSVFALVLTQFAVPTIAVVTTTNTVGSASAVDFDTTTEKFGSGIYGYAYGDDYFGRRCNGLDGSEGWGYGRCVYYEFYASEWRWDNQ